MPSSSNRPTSLFSLPTDIIIQIFPQPILARPINYKSLCTSQPPWTLTCVCRKWKPIALDLPQLGSYVDLCGYGSKPKADSESEENCSSGRQRLLLLLHGLILRSDEHPLTLRIGCPTSYHESNADEYFSNDQEPPLVFINTDLQAHFLPQLLVHQERWQDVVLWVTSCGLTLREFQGLGLVEGVVGFPLLRRLDLCPQGRNYLEHILEFFQTLQAFGWGDMCPCLAEATLRNIWIGKRNLDRVASSFSHYGLPSLRFCDVAGGDQCSNCSARTCIRDGSRPWH
ncbi:hypothetical protein BDV98DRAFT_49552 [Pterulicium gracile]|uniref:F-box domain-containing protein n=1 Tax=Pterulicium gracile TaxID=1884261 RepID=A0A5C3QL48_9AGAR|nr:hypothetical protein BDV98DRAFT_49552 [Pterula gracilis]